MTSRWNRPKWDSPSDIPSVSLSPDNDLVRAYREAQNNVIDALAREYVANRTAISVISDRLIAAKLWGGQEAIRHVAQRLKLENEVLERIAQLDPR